MVSYVWPPPYGRNKIEKYRVRLFPLAPLGPRRPASARAQAGSRAKERSTLAIVAEKSYKGRLARTLANVAKKSY